MRYPVQLDPRHLSRLSGPLLTGVIELIWNSIDADATAVTVRLEDNGIGGTALVEIIDDGHGIDTDTARDGFLALGRSWKADGGGSKTLGRGLHGKEGRGRFKLFRHGGTAKWESVSELKGQRERIAITIRDGDREIEIEELGACDDPLGTRVVLSGFGSAPQGLTGRLALDRLLGQFALPIEEYDLRINYDNQPIDPSHIREGREDLSVENSIAEPVTMTVIQWTRAIGHQDLYLCSADGAVLEKIPSQVAAPGLHFTAYLRWDGFTDNPANLAAAELDSGEIGEMIGAGRRRLEQHFDLVLAQRQRQIIGAWKDEGVYPFDGPSADSVDQAARKTFDVVALEAAETVNRGGNRLNKKLALRLLREALESNPGQIHKVVGDVLALPDERLADLAALLERTQLSQIISASREITDRLDFLHALGDLTCDPATSEHVRERKHLHLILENHPWVFGEEYALALGEAGLTQVLAKHIQLLGRHEIAPDDEPVRDTQGHIRRIDLMLAAAVPRPDDTHEHLVVELKAPKVAIGASQLQQVKDYALAVAGDDRFDARRTRWEFWAVSTKIEGTADRERKQRGRPVGLVMEDEELNIRVWARTWAEILHDAEHRLRYVKEKLGVAPDQQTALEYLRRVHAERLPETLQDRAA